MQRCLKTTDRRQRPRRMFGMQGDQRKPLRPSRACRNFLPTAKVSLTSCGIARRSDNIDRAERVHKERQFCTAYSTRPRCSDTFSPPSCDGKITVLNNGTIMLQQTTAAEQVLQRLNAQNWLTSADQQRSTTKTQHAQRAADSNCSAHRH